MNHSSIALYNEVYQAARAGFTSLDAMEKALGTSSPLTPSIRRQKQVYSDMIVQSATSLKNAGQMAQDIGTFKKFQMKTGINAGLMMDKGTSHAAEMIIQGATMGITTMQQKLNQLTAAEPQARDLGSRMIQADQRYIEQMKQYL